MKIAVLDYRIPMDFQDQIQSLASNQVVFSDERCPGDLAATRTGDADIVLLTPWEKVDKTYLDACPNLKYVGLCGTSTANIDLEEVAKRNIAFSNVAPKPEDRFADEAGGKEGVAEFFFMQLVRLARGIGEYQWKKGEVHQLKDRSLGIIGLGHVGQGIAHMALAYKMQSSYFSPHRKQEWEDKGLEYNEMDDLLKTCEIIVICSPTNIEVIGKPEFELINPGSVIVQACGGSPFDKPAFYEWIEHDGNFAIFDMSANEQNYALYKDLPGVIFSKKVAGDTYESNYARGHKILENLKSFLSA